MKSPQVKYEEAVARNLASLKSTMASKSVTRDALQKLTLEGLKIRTGIRAIDTRFDEDLTLMLASIKPAKPAKADKAEADAPEKGQDLKAVEPSPATKKSSSRADKIAARLKRPAAK